MDDDKKGTEAPERRSLVCAVELREEGESGGGRIAVRIPYDEETVIGAENRWFRYREVIRRGFFAPALEQSQDVVSWYWHGDGAQIPLGRCAAGTLELRDTDEYFEAVATPPEREWVEDIRVSIRRGDINGASFMFTVDDKGEHWPEVGKDELPLRELVLARRVYDVSPLPMAQYAGAQVDLRASAGQPIRTPEQVYRSYQETRQAPEAQPPNTNGFDEIELYRYRLRLGRR